MGDVNGLNIGFLVIACVLAKHMHVVVWAFHMSHPFLTHMGVILPKRSEGCRMCM